MHLHLDRSITASLWSVRCVAALTLMSAAAAQFGPRESITSDAQEPYSLFATDLDDDGDVDLLTASYSILISFSHGDVAWHENLGGGAFAPRQLIATDVSGVRDVHAADLDGDGDEDVLSASGWDDGIAWYENLGSGSFGPRQDISSTAFFAQSVYTADIDGDGDADVLSASCSDSKIAWYENLGNGAFGPQQIISTLATCARDVHAADIDGDGDTDVVSASDNDRKIAWYENLGGGSFDFQSIISQDLSNPSSVLAADLDGDGDADVLASSIDDRDVAWFENLGGGSFGPLQRIAGNTRSYEVFAADLDGDFDLDVLTTGLNTSRINWHENRGGGDFGPRRRIAQVTSPRTIHAADFDGDGDADVVYGHFLGEISWNENLRPIFNECQPAVVNSTGLPGTITATGSVDVLNNDLTLVASQLPPGAFGLFLNGRTGTQVPGHGGSIGTLCIGSPIGRYERPGEIQSATVVGDIDLRLDLASTPTPTGFVAIVPGETWHFQCWYRDRDGLTMTAISNLTDAVLVTFR